MGVCVQPSVSELPGQLVAAFMVVQVGEKYLRGTHEETGFPLREARDELVGRVGKRFTVACVDSLDPLPDKSCVSVLFGRLECVGIFGMLPIRDWCRANLDVDQRLGFKFTQDALNVCCNKGIGDHTE